MNNETIRRLLAPRVDRRRRRRRDGRTRQSRACRLVVFRRLRDDDPARHSSRDGGPQPGARRLQVKLALIGLLALAPIARATSTRTRPVSTDNRAPVVCGALTIIFPPRFRRQKLSPPSKQSRTP